jgi:uncharacterized protein (DUF433 family)
MFDLRMPIVQRHPIYPRPYCDCAGNALGFPRMEKSYHSDPQILGGEPVFVGTRVPIQSLFDHLEAGESIDEFLKGFPSVKREQIVALLNDFRQQVLAQLPTAKAGTVIFISA